MQPSSGGEYLYANGNPVNHTDPSGLCVFCEPGDRVKVDARPERLADIYARPDPNSPRVDRVYDEQWVRVSRWPTQGGQDEWQRVLTGNSRSGWILNRKLLDNCDGPPGTFGCLPIARWNSQADWNWGFGPSQFAYNNCHPGLFGGGDCPYNNLRGLHNGLDFVAPRSSTLIWPGTGDGRALFEPNPYPNDAAPNIVIEYGDRRVVFGHVTRNYPCDNHMSEVRSGQTIGESGESNGAHLHFGVRSGETVHYNPLYYFTSALQSQIVRSMGEYYRGFNAYEMISFDAGAVDDLPFAERNFWRLPCPDYRGIVFRHHH
jgi:murein DD-endopeptidase MepM/ murein hydrolase activator NlpD